MINDQEMVKINRRVEEKEEFPWKKVIVWGYLIRLLLNILMIILIIVLGTALSVTFHKKWMDYIMLFGRRNMIIVSLTIAILLSSNLVSSIDNIYIITTSNLLTKLRYTGDDPQQLMLYRK